MPNRRRSLAGRLLVTYAVAVLLLVTLFGFVVERLAREALLDAVEYGLIEQARTVSELLPDDPTDSVQFVDELARGVDARITVISADGSVIADSLAEPTGMENHSGRPEVRAAFEGGVGTDRRVSTSTGFDQTYVAVRAPQGVVVRLSLPQNTVDAQVGDFRSGLALVVALVAIAGVVVVALVGRRLARPLTDLSDAATAMAAGDLEVPVPRSSVEELDRVGRSLQTMAQELGDRIAEVDGERRTLEAVLGALPQGTLLIGSDDRIVYANPALIALLGRTSGTVTEIVPFRIQEALRAARASGETVDLEVEHGRPARTLQVLVAPFGDGRVLVVVTDVTDQRKVDEVRRDFVTNASHELKTPVASILAASETLQLAIDRAPERLPEFASRIEMSARSLARLVSDLLDLSRLEGSSPSFEEVDLESVVRSEVERVRTAAAESGVAIEVTTAPISVVGSEPDLALAVRNLVDNAIRYTDAGGTVTADLSEDEGDAVLSVADTGAGIPQRDIGRVFERFYRVDEARARETGGTGLGLSIVKHVVESHGGTVAVESELGVGSTFTIRLEAVGVTDDPPR